MFRLVRNGVRHQSTAVAELAGTLRTGEWPLLFWQMVLQMVLQNLRAGHDLAAHGAFKCARLQMASHVQRHQTRFDKLDATANDVALDGVRLAVVVAQRLQIYKSLLGAEHTNFITKSINGTEARTLTLIPGKYRNPSGRTLTANPRGSFLSP